MQRTKEDGTVVDNFTYAYGNGNNQLTHVDDAVVGNADIQDLKDQNANNYVYDVLGRLTDNVAEDIRYVYNTQGLVTEIRKRSNNALVISVLYNERGQRIQKNSYNTVTGVLLSTDYYVLDLSGNVMALYTKLAGQTVVLKENTIFGGSRLGVFKKATSQTSYEITDHLGNVRAVIERPIEDTTSLFGILLSYADYYAFGEQLPSRNTTSDYRYAFQGQELDKETGMEAFQLRLWDGRIGRWLSPDPYGQYASPYLGMGNNPISMIDPDGGFAFPERDGYGDGDTWADADGSWRWDSKKDMWIGQNGTNTDWSRSVNVGGSNPMISKYEPNFFGRIQENYLNSKTSDNIIQSSLKTLGNVVYNIVDDAFVYGTRNFTKDSSARHLNDMGADKQEVMGSGLNTIMLITPSPIKGSLFGMKYSASPPSLLSKFNVATFGSTFKGTFLTKLSPATRGQVIVITNKISTFFTSRGMFLTYNNSLSKKINEH